MSHVPRKSGVRYSATNERPRLKFYLHQFYAFYSDHRQGGSVAAGGLGNLAHGWYDVTKSNNRQQSHGLKCFCSLQTFHRSRKSIELKFWQWEGLACVQEDGGPFTYNEHSQTGCWYLAASRSDLGGGGMNPVELPNTLLRGKANNVLEQ